MVHVQMALFEKRKLFSFSAFPNGVLFVNGRNGSGSIQYLNRCIELSLKDMPELLLFFYAAIHFLLHIIYNAMETKKATNLCFNPKHFGKLTQNPYIIKTDNL